MPELRAPAGAALAVLGGLTYWSIVSALSGGAEPWDAPGFWSIAFPGALVLCVLLGFAAPSRAWAWGAILMLTQVPIVIVVSRAEPDPLLVVGLLYATVLALPAALLSWLGGVMRGRYAQSAH